MGTDHHGLTGHSVALSLAKLRQQVLDSDMPERRRREIASALKTIARALGLPLEAIPTDPETLRQKLAGCTSAMAGVSDGRCRSPWPMSVPSRSLADNH